MTNTLNQQPLYASLQLTDYLFCWQAGQSPSTRKMPVSGLAAYYASLAGCTFTGAVTISSGGLVISSDGASITGSLIVTGSSVISSDFTVNGNTQLSATSVIGALTVAGVTTATNTAYIPLQGYIAGLTLSNDSGSPNTVLDIAAGWASDSTNQFPVILLSAFTKSTAGLWAAGSGANGMGNGLVIGNNTWYHVFAINVSNVGDVYFDTSVTAANAPAGSSAFRRIGSFLTDSSAHIVAFAQIGDEFIWKVSVTDVSADTALSNVKKLYTIFHVPPDVSVTARLQISAINSGGSTAFGFSSPAMTTLAVATVVNVSASVPGGGQVLIRTDTTREIAAISGLASGNTISIFTDGWIDSRGRFG
jgi:hypothetical protein